MPSSPAGISVCVQRAYVLHLQACHGAEGEGALPTEMVLAEVSPSISNPDLRDFVRSGDPELKMPSFASRVREDALEDLVAFLRSWEKR